MADRVTVPFVSGGRQSGKTASLMDALNLPRTDPDLLRRMKGAALTYQQAASRLHRQQASPPPEVKFISIDEAGDIDQHMIDAMKYGMGARMQVYNPPKTLADFSTAELVMHMIERGYVVMKLPEDGQLPEALR